MSKDSPVRRTTGASIPARRVVLAPRTTMRDGSDSGDELHWITTRDKYLIRDFRQVMRENQTAFWRRFGVTQTRGSRFERGKAVPLPVLMLMRMYLRNVIDDTDLQTARLDEEDGGDLRLADISRED